MAESAPDDREQDRLLFCPGCGRYHWPDVYRTDRTGGACGMCGAPMEIHLRASRGPGPLAETILGHFSPEEVHLIIKRLHGGS